MNMYSPESMLSFEGEQFMGQEAIFGKLTGIGELTHTINTCDCQPSANEGIAVLVSGSLKIDGGNDMMFTEAFLLQKGGTMGYYVLNDFFRLNLAG